jgi:NAD-dependent DNA ligase
MSQKELFEKLQSIIDYAGAKNAILALEIMYKTYSDSDNEKIKEHAALILHIKNELSELLLNAEEYKEERAFRDEIKKAFTPSEMFSHRSISSENKKQDLSIVENTSTIFYNQKVVITGEFERFPERDNLASILKNYGADINGSISGRTNIVCIGENFGPSKIKKIEQLLADGSPIIILYEKDLYKCLDSIN